jgi:hypothetical protein
MLTLWDQALAKSRGVCVGCLYTFDIIDRLRIVEGGMVRMRVGLSFLRVPGWWIGYAEQSEPGSCNGS